MKMKYACLLALLAILTFSIFKKDITDEPLVPFQYSEVQRSLHDLKIGEAWSKPFSNAALLPAPLPRSAQYVPPRSP